MNLTVCPSNPIPRYLCNINENFMWVFIAALFIITKNWEQFIYPSAGEKVNKCHWAVRQRKRLMTYSQLIISHFALALPNFSWAPLPTGPEFWLAWKFKQTLKQRGTLPLPLTAHFITDHRMAFLVKCQLFSTNFLPPHFLLPFLPFL